VSYTSGIHCSRRTLQSDVLAVHQSDPNLVFAGLRNGSVALEDLRVTSRQINRVGGTLKQKAVVGVRRLSASAVPWGLIVSGLSDEVCFNLSFLPSFVLRLRHPVALTWPQADGQLLIYDIRFSNSPLNTCPGHINKYHDRLVSPATLPHGLSQPSLTHRA
jgi:WD repeat-containing protein 21A